MSKVSTKYQVTIPVDVRKKFKIEVGDRILFREESGQLIIEKA